MKLPKIKLSGINLINLAGVVIIIYLIFVLGQTVKRNYELGEQIDTLRTQTALLQDQKDQLSYSLQYYNTDAFRDREARSKLGLQLPGENLIILPRTSSTPASNPDVKTADNRSNFKRWMDFLSGREIHRQ